MSYSPTIRPYRADDRSALYDICVRTAHEGGDSREIYPDHDLMPSIFASEVMVDLMHRPERMILPELSAYPAHLHVDLLPAHQGAGHGRALMWAFLRTLDDRGVGAVHLGIVTANTGARAFYDRLGFHETAVTDPGPLTYLGRPTAD